MRMKIRKIGHAEPNLDGSLFQKPSVTKNLTGLCNLVQNASTTKSNLDKNISDEGSEIQGDFEKKCICLRPLERFRCYRSDCVAERLRTACIVHPADLYLLDMDQCGKCKSIFIKEVDMTQEQA